MLKVLSGALKFALVNRHIFRVCWFISESVYCCLNLGVQDDSISVWVQSGELSHNFVFGVVELDRRSQVATLLIVAE